MRAEINDPKHINDLLAIPESAQDTKKPVVNHNDEIQSRIFDLF